MKEDVRMFAKFFFDILKSNQDASEKFTLLIFRLLKKKSTKTGSGLEISASHDYTDDCERGLFRPRGESSSTDDCEPYGLIRICSYIYTLAIRSC